MAGDNKWLCVNEFPQWPGLIMEKEELIRATSYYASRFCKRVHSLTQRDEYLVVRFHQGDSRIGKILWGKRGFLNSLVHYSKVWPHVIWPGLALF